QSFGDALVIEPGRRALPFTERCAELVAQPPAECLANPLSCSFREPLVRCVRHTPTNGFVDPLADDITDLLFKRAVRSRSEGTGAGLLAGRGESSKLLPRPGELLP